MVLNPKARRLSGDEIRLVQVLLSVAESKIEAQSLTSQLVMEMDDGGMGSLRFLELSDPDSSAVQAAAVMFTDADEVTVWATLFTNQRGELYELDLFKGDFSPLIAIPSVSEIIPSPS